MVEQILMQGGIGEHSIDARVFTPPLTETSLNLGTFDVSPDASYESIRQKDSEAIQQKLSGKGLKLED